MSVEEHLQEFHGLPVVAFPSPKDRRPLPDAAGAAWRLAVDVVWDHRYNRSLLESFEEKWERFLQTVDAPRVQALVIGAWSEYFEVPATRIAELLVDAADRLPDLRAVFFGDLVREESDLAYIQLCDLTRVAEAYPRLEVLGARGADRFGPVQHRALHTLRFESGGLPRAVLDGVLGSELPELASLDLWLGVGDYGGDIAAPDLAPLLSGQLFPKLRHLGLEDSEVQDEIATALAGAPVVARLESLSLAFGTLTDEGAAALLDGQPLTHLHRLDLHHHFLTDAMAERLRAALPGVELDLAEPQEADEDDGEIWRYVAFAE
ncbi:STM4015 family protein [Kitasatospora sp. NPDC058965]|uniref:STM4015 family protein n=1 Tax=Kitasatospora sp. NPDC058965 TaxID=3346682 RepID=UPI0036BFEB10